jgi:ankyrin repeat protein
MQMTMENNDRPTPAEVNRTPELPPAHAAVQSGDSSAVATALLAGATVDERDETQATPLLRAAWHGQLAIVRLLLSQGASINATDSAGQTAMHLAVTYDHPVVVRALLAAGADPNIRAHAFDVSPFFLAILHGSTDVALAMARRGATLTADDLKRLEVGAKLYPKTVAPTLAAVRRWRP